MTPPAIPLSSSDTDHTHATSWHAAVPVATQRLSLTPDAANDASLPPMADMVRRYVQGYLDNLGDDTLADAGDVYNRFLSELERPLLEEVMQATGGNQLKTARVLGINRNTLRKKLKQHQLIAE